MDMINATDVRKNWSVTLDNVAHERPAYVKRTHDNVAIFSINTLNMMLAGYHFNAKKYKEYKENNDKKEQSRNLYDILDGEYMVCVGYATLLGDLLNKLGI